MKPGPSTSASRANHLPLEHERSALQLALGEFATELLASRRVLPRAALQAGFSFQHPELTGALRDLLTPTR